MLQVPVREQQGRKNVALRTDAEPLRYREQLGPLPRIEINAAQ